MHPEVFDDLKNKCCFLIARNFRVMAVRALESGIRTYCSKFGQNYTEKMSFGQMVADLKKSPKADTKFVGYLDYLKDTRNDLAHPNVRIEQFEAEQVFQHTIHVLERIYSWTSK